jgi:hypothetical protein
MEAICSFEVYKAIFDSRLLLLLGSWFVYSSTIKMEAICTSETADSLRTTRCYSRENLSAHKAFYITGKYLKIEASFILTGLV